MRLGVAVVRELLEPDPWDVVKERRALRGSDNNARKTNSYGMASAIEAIKTELSPTTNKAFANNL